MVIKDYKVKQNGKKKRRGRKKEKRENGSM